MKLRAPDSAHTSLASASWKLRARLAGSDMQTQNLIAHSMGGLPPAPRGPDMHRQHPSSYCMQLSENAHAENDHACARVVGAFGSCARLMHTSSMQLLVCPAQHGVCAEGS
jgi:hypothetical protein